MQFSSGGISQSISTAPGQNFHVKSASSYSLW